MSGLKEKTWKKWKGSQTTSPVAVTNKKTTDSISSQRSSSLIRSRKRHVPQNVADNILAAESEEIITPRNPVEDGDIKRVKANNKGHFDTGEKNDFRDKSTSPFNTLAPTNPFNRENVMIVQYGEVKENEPLSDMQESNELWGELPSAEVVESPKPAREKGPRGGSKRPTTSKKPKHKSKLVPSASPTNKKSSPPVSPQTHIQQPPTTPTQATPHTTSGPSIPHDPPPRSGQSQHPRTSPSADTGKGTCDYPECPARGTKQKERLCMAPECPVTLKKAVVKEAKRAMKESCAKKRKNPLTILGFHEHVSEFSLENHRCSGKCNRTLDTSFAGHDSSCKLTKEEKKALKRMKESEEYNDDGCNRTARPKKSKGVQCKAPMLQRSDRARSEPKKADKSTTCDIPECPVAMQKKEIKKFMDKGQLCNIPSCPVKEPPPAPPPPPPPPPPRPRKEKKVEPPKGCPSKPCTLKTKDEEFFKQLDPCIFEKLPRLKMTCEQALAEDHGGQSRPHHTPAGIKNKEKPPGVNRTKDKEVKIVVAPVHVPPASENPFMETIPNAQEFSAWNKLAGEQSKGNQLSSDRTSECQKIVDPWLLTPAVLSKAKSEKFDCTRSSSPILREKEISVIRAQDGLINGEVPKILLSNIAVEQKDDLRPQSPPDKNEQIESHPAYLSLRKSKSSSSVKMKFEKSLANGIEPNHAVYVVSHHVSQSRLMTSRTLLPSANGLVVKSTQSSHSTTSVNDSYVTACAVYDQALRGEATEEFFTSMNVSATARSNDMEMKRSGVSADVQIGTVKFEEIAKNLLAPKSSTLIGESHFEIRKSRSLKFDCPEALEDNQAVIKTPVNLLSVMPVNHSSASDTISNQILKEPFGLPIMKESYQQIKLHERNGSTSKYSTASLTGQITSSPGIERNLESDCNRGCSSKTMSGTKNVRAVHEPSEENQFKKPIMSLHMYPHANNDEKLSNHKISDKTTPQCVGENEQAGDNPIEHSEKSNDLKETCIQTLATSAISPNELNTIGLGTDSMVDLRSEGLASQIMRED